MEFKFSFESLKQNFFGKAATEMLSKEEKRALGRMGAYTRTIAKNSLKYNSAKKGNEPSSAGTPPHVHRRITRVRLNKKTGETKEQQVSPFKELLFFAYDPSSQSTVVGPSVFSGRGTRSYQPVGSTVPGLHERGGRAVLRKEEIVKRGGPRATPKQRETFLRKIKDGTITRSVERVIKLRSANYPLRPFMKPAMLKAMPKFAGMFQVTGGAGVSIGAGSSSPFIKIAG